MSIFKRIFNVNKTAKSKNDSKLPSAVAFIDYEHWFISMENNYHTVPDIKGWFESVKKECNLTDVIFFANFSKFKNKELEVKRIRAFTNKIIDTFNPDTKFEKDYTDFIILDNIYQRAIQDKSNDMFIIFTGDGHFNSVIAFLKNFCGKDVTVYGVKGCINNNLRQSASRIHEIPDANTNVSRYYEMILTNLHHIKNKPNSFPTFNKTVEKVSEFNNVSEDSVKEAMIKLINDGYIVKKVKVLKQTKVRGKGKGQEETKEIKYLAADWRKISRDRIWKPDK